MDVEDAVSLFYKQANTSKMLKNSLKVHLLQHIPLTYSKFGPLHLYEAELPEAGNGDVRHNILHSNRRKISQDSAEMIGRQYCLRNLVNNAWWIDKSGKQKIIGRAFNEFRTNSKIQSLLNKRNYQCENQLKKRICVGEFWEIDLNNFKIIGECIRIFNDQSSHTKSYGFIILTCLNRSNDYGMY